MTFQINSLIQGGTPNKLWNRIAKSIEANAPHKFKKALKAVSNGHYNLNYKVYTPTKEEQSTLLQMAVITLCQPNYAPREGFEDDLYLYARMLLKHGTMLQSDFYTRDKLGEPPMDIAMKNDNAGLVVFFMQYGYRLDNYDLLTALGHSAEKSCISLMQWGAFFHIAEKIGKIFCIRTRGILFCVAAEKNLFGLMRIMIYNNPQYLQEDWVVNIEPEKCRNNRRKRFWGWMQKERKQPAALQLQCRKTILKQLIKKIEEKHVPTLKVDIKKPVFNHAPLSAAIDELPLPKGLREILQIPDLQEAMEDTGISDYAVLQK